MEFEIKTTNLEEIRDIAKQQLENAANAETEEARKAFQSNLETAIDEYNRISKDRMLRKVMESENPMHTAVLMFFYPTIKVKEVKDKETKIVTSSIVDAEKPIDLMWLHGRMANFGADHKWLHSAEKFNFHLTLRAAERLGVDAELQKKLADCFVMTDIAKQRDLGKNPCSNTQMLKTLTVIIQEMLGDGFKPTSHDVNFLIDVYAQDAKKSKTNVSLANHKTLCGYLKKICYRILTGGTSYGIEQKECKEK